MGIQPLLTHEEITKMASHELIETCHYSQSYTDNTASITVYSSRVFTIDQELAEIVPEQHRTKDFRIGTTLKPSSQHKHAKQLPLHKLPTPVITPQEASMAFGAVNKCKGDSPAVLIGHRGKVYVAWVTERSDRPDTLLGIFRHWKDCKRAVHQVSNAGYEKSKNLSKAHETYPALMEDFMRDYKQAIDSNSASTAAKKRKRVTSPRGTTSIRGGARTSKTNDGTLDLEIALGTSSINKGDVSESSPSMSSDSSFASSISSTSTSDNISDPATAISHISLDTLLLKYPDHERTITKLASAGHPAQHIDIYLNLSGVAPTKTSP
jgi:hypothetical protein